MKKSSKKWGEFTISILLHVLVIVLLVVGWKKSETLFLSGGGSGNVTVTMVTFDKASPASNTNAVTSTEGIKVKQKKESAPVQPAPSLGRGNSQVSAGGAGSGIDSSSVVGDSSQVLTQIRAKIEKAKRYPLAAKDSGLQGTVNVRFTLRQDGTIGQSSLVSSSGQKILDDEALQTLKRGEPYPVYAGAITIGIKFALEE